MIDMPVDKESGDCVGKEVEHLIKEKGYKKKVAVAAAMNMCSKSKKVEKTKKELEIELLKKVIEKAKRR